ncbi:MAG: ATP-dependent protease subunit HslV [Thermotaleaceae bacterium]
MFHGTTIVAVRRSSEDIAIGGDGQVTFGEKMIMKHRAKKVRRLYKEKVLVGFAGSVSDAFTLTEKFEAKLEQHGGNLKRAAVELAQEWRQDKILRKLEALMIAADKETLLLISGNGEIIEPDEGVIAIGSGGSYAFAAGKALYEHTNLSASNIVHESLQIAASICVYTNSNITVETL